MKMAFKEWAVICHALAAGEQVLILRKGGIVEEGGQFRPDHPKFLLFPTYSHQGRESVVPLAQPWLVDMDAEQPETGTVVFRHWAEVTSALQVRSLAAVLRLRGQHVWSDDVVEERFHRWRDAIYALVVRVYKLPSLATLEMREDYTGCKSWVELADDIATEGSRPVLGDNEFARRTAEIREALESAP